MKLYEQNKNYLWEKRKVFKNAAGIRKNKEDWMSLR